MIHEMIYIERPDCAGKGHLPFVPGAEDDPYGRGMPVCKKEF